MVWVSIRAISVTAFTLGFATLFWQYYEFAWKLAEAGAITSTVWSGTWGPPIPHHGYWGAALTLIGFIGVTLRWRK